jgi:hypothetical protein
MKVIQKISACIVLSDILEKTKAMAHVSIISSKEIHFTIFTNRRAVPEMLFASTLKNFERAFGVLTSYKIVSTGRSGRSSRRRSAVASTIKKLQDVKVIA